MQLVIIPNPFQRQYKDICDLPFNNESLEIILRGFLNKSKDILVTFEEAQEGIRISINGRIIPPELWGFHKPLEKDQIIFMPVVAKGDTEKQILNIAVIIAVTVAVGPQGLGLIGAGASFGSAALGLAIIAGTGMLLQSLTPSPQAKGFAPDDWDNSQVYSWSPQTTQKQGIVRPKFYGKNRLNGNAIAVHTEIDPADDTKQILKMLIGLGDGPVKGIVDGTIKINDQNIENYTDIITEERLGTLNQSSISFFTEIKPEFRPNRLVTNSGGAVIYTTPDSDFQDLEIELLWNRGLYFANNQGGLSNHTVGIKIEISEADAASWDILVEESITDATTSPKRKNYIASETYTGGSPVTITEGLSYDIRITKTSSDQSSSRYGDGLRLGSVREVLTDLFIYPKLSLLGIEALATDQLSGSINVSCIQEGAIVNVYNGSTWNLEYSTNPAWVLFDVFTQPVISGDGESGTPYNIERYEGTNPSSIDIAEFYVLSQFCDTLVPDGKGGTEKRITFNGGFDIGTSVWGAALKVCEICRCMPIYTGSELTLAIDKADDFVQMFNVSDINQDSFKESFMPQSELISEIEIQYRDENQDFKRVPFTILNENIPNASRRITLELFGIIKQSEAWRAGKHRLDQNQYLKSTTDIDADIDAVNSTIGNVIKIQHDVPDWGQGGRIISGPTTTSIIVNKDMVYISGAQHEVNLRKSDNTLNKNFVTTSKFNDITGVNQGGNQFQISGNFANEYLEDDSIRLEDSTGNDKDYTLSTGAVHSAGTTTITVNEVIPDGTVDGGLFNLRRIVVNTPFLNSSSAAEVAEEFDIYTFGVQNLNAREYRILNLRKTQEQYITITSVIYDERVYDGDSEDPIITLDEAINNPESDNTELIVLNPNWGDVERRYPPAVSIGPPNLDTPQVTDIIFSDDVPNLQVTWTEGILSYKGAVYSIAADVSGALKYIWWDVNDNPTILHSSDTQEDGIGSGKFILCVNNSGVAFVIGVGLPYWGELLAVEVLSALTAQLGDVLAGSITGTLITGGLFRTSVSGRRVQMNSDGITLLTASPSSGVVGTTGAGGDNIIVGTTANGGDNEIVGAGVLASINSPQAGKEVPFRIESEQAVGDFHYFDRNNTPSGAATPGDTCVVQGVHHSCTVGGTPGTWVATGTQT